MNKLFRLNRKNKRFKTYKVRLNSANTKSQAAMEFLMTYGWAFLIVLIVIFSLIYFGILDPYQFLPEKAELGEGVDIVDASVDENSISFILRNTMGRDIYDFQINATGCNDGNGTLSTAVDIPEGKTKKITIYCEHDYAVGSKIDSGLEALWKTRTSTKGERYDFDQKTTGIVKVTVNKGKELYDREGISACGTLNQTRSIYTLQNNVTSPTDTCFTVTADYVTIDLNGYNITGGGVNYGVDSTNYNHTIVRNGTISGFSTGIYYRNSNNGSLSNINTSGSTNGLYLFGSNYNSLSDINASGNTIGLYIGYSSSYNNVTGSVTNDNGDRGFYIRSNCNYNTFVDITSNGNREGIEAYNGFMNTYTDVIVNGNSDRGLYLYEEDNTTVTNITANNNQESGIKIYWYAYNNTIINASLNGNQDKGLEIYVANTSNISGLIVNDSTNYGMHFTGTAGNTITDSNISNSGITDVNITTDSPSNTFLNMSYSTESMGTGSVLTRKWYYKTYVDDGSDPISGATLQAMNSTGNVINSLTTGSDGWTGLGEVVEYVNNAGTKNYYNNYTINVSDAAYVGQHSNYNVSTEENKLDDTITVAIVDPYVAFALGTPYDGSSQAENDIYVNVTAGTSNGNASTFIDFYDSLVSWWRMDDLGLGDEMVSCGDFSCGTNWSFGSTCFLMPGLAGCFSGILGQGIIQKNISVEAGKTYNLTYTIISIDSGDFVYPWLGGSPLSFRFSPGTYSQLVTTISSQNLTFYIGDFIGMYFTNIDDVLVQEVNASVVDYMNRNNGTKQGDASQNPSGRMRKGFEFDGDGDYIELNSAEITRGEQGSIIAWVKLGYLYPNGYSIFTATNDASGIYILKFGFSATSGALEIYQRNADTADIIYGNFLRTWSTEKWYHVAVVSNGSYYSLYVDGLPEPLNVQMGSNSGDWFDDTSNIDSTLIGAQDKDYSFNFFNGTIDDVMIFNRSLSEEEVRALYASSSSKYVGTNFTGLGSGDYTFKAYVQDTSGNVNSTEERTVTIS